MAKTSKKVGKLASKLLRKDLPRKKEKSVAASALRQRRGRQVGQTEQKLSISLELDEQLYKNW